MITGILGVLVAGAPAVAKPIEADQQATRTAVRLVAESCKTVKISKNLRGTLSVVKKDYRLGAVNLQQYWCFDGQKITHAAEPVVTTSLTKAAGLSVVWKITSKVSNKMDPQNGGYWTQQAVVTGTADQCVLKYGCVYGIPFTMELLVFGDGETFNVRPGNIG
ncbi:hypothetical protein [Pseudonocardia charpentierae]|uniref:Uncharacterized protein n=1 Tax=Pseudonocardia charpentierae TaxID=3075545 RepID=A0ABU2NCG9_9PSEU|nr:hypothetical protein [Pseudonocardia sp. DSM 45834]MDT0351651.1 hypothetical protein [Pseudonocardia sp. DSM 45834]